MRVERLEYEGFRNLETGSIQPVPEVNILYGQNGQGKTNLLESIWFFTGGRSFRGAKDSDTVGFGQEKASLKMDFFAQDRSQQAEINIEKRRSASLEGISLPSATHLAGTFCAVVFSPAHLTLIKDGPDGRRRFLDAAYCQLRPGYMRVLAEYQRILTQRNALLKNIRNGQRAEGLEIWDERLAEAGARVFAARTAYIRKMTPAVKNIYSGISGGKENIEIEYSSAAGDISVLPEEARQRLLSLLKENVCVDTEAGFTTIGPHRDDLVVDIDGKAARFFASQGQQRSAVLALKLAEASVLKQVTGEQPVALLDDVMSELDPARQDYVLNHIHGWQVFLTCCDPSPVMKMNGGRVFHVDKGRITDMTSERGV